MGKTATTAMNYEATGKKKVSRSTAYTVMAKEIPSWYLVKELVYRHRVGLLILGNIVLLLNWAIPMWFSMVQSLFVG